MTVRACSDWSKIEVYFLALITIATTCQCQQPHHPFLDCHTTTMSSPRTLSALARSRAVSRGLTPNAAARTSFAAAFSTTARRQVTTEGAPPQGFRLPPGRDWKTRKDSVFDQAANYFLLTEMARGMWVLLEQFFRPPYVLYTSLWPHNAY